MCPLFYLGGGAMKKILLIACLLAVSSGAVAQVIWSSKWSRDWYDDMAEAVSECQISVSTESNFGEPTFQWQVIQGANYICQYTNNWDGCPAGEQWNHAGGGCEGAPDACDPGAALANFPPTTQEFTYSRLGGDVSVGLGVETFFVCSSDCLVEREITFSVASETIVEIIVSESQTASVYAPSCDSPPGSSSTVEPTVFPGSTVSSDGDNAPDTDGDGQANDSDEDIDGDGDPNSSDADSDGDGIPNADDGAPNGEDEGVGESVTASSTCNVSPVCEGSAIQCAQLIEQWRNRCENPSLVEVGDGQAGEITSGLDTQGDSLLDGYETAAIDAIGTNSGITLDTGLGAKIESLFGFGSGSCTDYSIATPALGRSNAAGSITLRCADTQIIRSMFAYLFVFLTVWMIYNIARKPVER